MKTILIACQKGGVGKSTLTLNLALNLRKNCRVAILDMDLQGSLTRLAGTVNDLHITTNKSILERDEEYDLIFIDTPPYLSNELDGLIRRADLIIVPTKAGVLDLLAIEGTIDLISDARKEPNTLIVLNMVKPNTTLTKDIQVRVEAYGITVAETQVSDLVSFTRSVVVQGLGNNKAQRQLDSLTKEMLTALL